MNFIVDRSPTNSGICIDPLTHEGNDALSAACRRPGPSKPLRRSGRRSRKWIGSQVSTNCGYSPSGSWMTAKDWKRTFESNLGKLEFKSKRSARTHFGASGWFEPTYGRLTHAITSARANSLVTLGQNNRVSATPSILVEGLRRLHRQAWPQGNRNDTSR